MFERLEETGIIPVVSISNARDALPLAKALYEGGLSCVEVTFRTEAARDAVAAISRDLPEMFILAGTVLSPEQADAAMKAGASMIVAPGLNPKVAKHCLEKGYPYIPGVCTASEIELARELGLRDLKFFPAEAMGGLRTLDALHAPYRDVRFMPTGGVSLHSAGDYLRRDYIFCVGGSWMARPETVEEGNFEEIRQLALQAADMVRSNRNG